MADFSIKKVGENLGDIQRAYTWELLIPTDRFTKLGITEKDLSIRCRSVVIPGRSQEIITSNFMGMEQFFPGRMKFTNPFNIMFEEFADRKIAKFLYEWQQLIFNIDEGGGSGKEFAIDVKLKVLTYDLADTATTGDYRTIQINKAWPESVAEVPMAYADNNAVQYTLALRYDTWEYL